MELVWNKINLRSRQLLEQRREKMSFENVEKIIGRAIMEGEYRELLFSEPDKALEEYELTVEEKSALKSIDRNKFDEVASELEDRVSRAGLTGLGKLLESNNNPFKRIFDDSAFGDNIIIQN
jgi:hypothetical protein